MFCEHWRPVDACITQEISGKAGDIPHHQLGAQKH